MSRAKSQRRMVVRRDGSSWCERSLSSVEIGADRLLVDARVLGGPVVFVAEAPEKDRWGGCSAGRSCCGACAAAHFFEDVVADAAAAPRNLFPDEDAESVAEIEHAARLLVVGEADEVCAHLLDELHLLFEKRSSGMAAA